MTTCAGCSPIENKLSVASMPSCLEPVVFPRGAFGSLPRTNEKPSYQCLACNRIWMFDSTAGYWSQEQLRRAA